MSDNGFSCNTRRIPSRSTEISPKFALIGSQAPAIFGEGLNVSLVSLTRSGLAAHDVIVAGALERNQRLVEQLDPAEVAMLLAHIDRLTRKAEAMLAVEKELG